MKKRYSLNLDIELIKIIDKMAKEEGRNRSNMINEILKKVIKEKKMDKFDK